MNFKFTKFKWMIAVLSIQICSFQLGVLQRAEAAVWESTQAWNQDWEARYRTWVANAWDKSFFLRPGSLLENSQVDCADAVYVMRAYFAYQNSLPFVMKDPTSRRSQTNISNAMTRWDSQPQTQRVRSFLRFVFGLGSTSSLPNDSYPAAISPRTLSSGSFVLTDPSKHHSWTIRVFAPTGIPHLIYASRPAKPQMFERKNYPSISFVFPNRILPESNAGFRNFRWPEDIGKPVHEVAGFSLEQYDIPPRNFMKSIQKKMQVVAETHEAKVARLLAEVCVEFSERVDSVRDAVKRNLELGSTCMNATEFDDHSTPSRDQRLKAAFEALVAAFEEGRQAKNLSACSFEVGPGQLLSLGQLYNLAMSNKLSSNPHDTLEMRWGLARMPSAKARSCPVY